MTDAAVAALLEQEDFIRDSVRPHVDGGTDAADVELTRHRHGIVEYRFAGDRRIFAKPFGSPEQARAAFDIQRSLWEGGFGPESAYRVAEPFAFHEDEGVVLMGAAPGDRLRELAAGDRGDWEDALRGAARWLAVLHASPHRLGPPDDAMHRVLHLARRVAATAARRPDLEPLLIRLLDELARRAPADASASPQVQTHGRYHPQHVYVAPDSVTVIDCDRATPGDPAKDVAEFLHRLRADARSAALTGDAVDSGSAAFLSEYARHSPADLSALEFYWSYSLLFTLVARGGRTDAADPDARDRIDFYEAEFAAVPARVATHASRDGGDR